MGNNIIWNNVKFARLLNGLNSENSEKPQRIRYSQGWTKVLPPVETGSAIYNAKLIGSYNSLIGLHLTDKTTGIDVLIVTDENHTITVTTAKQIAIYARSLFGVKVNLYDTGKPLMESMCGFNINRAPRAAQFANVPPKTRREFSVTGYSDILTGYSDILTEMNHNLKSWNRVE